MFFNIALIFFLSFVQWSLGCAAATSTGPYIVDEYPKSTISQVNNHHLKRLQSQIDVIDKGDLLQWQALNDSFTLAHIQALFGEVKCRDFQPSSRNFLLRQCWLPLNHQKQRLQCFFDQEGNGIFLRLEDIKTKEKPNELIAHWGQPDNILVLTGKQKYAPSKQLTYIDRGLTLYVLGSIESSKASLMAVEFFQKTFVDQLETLKKNETIQLNEN